MAGFSVAAIAFGSALDVYAVLFLCALALCAVGTLDDRIGLGIAVRLAVQVAVGVVIWWADLGWQFLGDPGDLALTVVWVVGLVNAFNLMDNLDGATGTVAAVSTAGAGVLALIEGQPLLAGLAFSAAGACTAFLRFNLARPSRIFLGDGGSMPLGLIVAVVIATMPGRSLGLEDLFALVPIAGLVILDTSLVVVSRLRRGAPVLSGSRDHLSHRLLGWTGSARGVAMVLAVYPGASVRAGDRPLPGGRVGRGDRRGRLRGRRACGDRGARAAGLAWPPRRRTRGAVDLNVSPDGHGWSCSHAR